MYKTNFKAPFLKKIDIEKFKGEKDQPSFNFVGALYPYNIGFLKKSFSITFDTPITVIVGENGSGKSTLLEAIAEGCGFNTQGGNSNHLYGEKSNISSLTKKMKLIWLPKIRKGFFLRAQTFYKFSEHIDDLAKEDPSSYVPYGGKSLGEMSHGESFLAFFRNRLRPNELYIFDEPEGALSTSRQVEFLLMLKTLEVEKNCQIIIATHSPLIMAYPSAKLLQIKDGEFAEIKLEDAPNYQIMKGFYSNPDVFMQEVLRD